MPDDQRRRDNMRCEADAGRQAAQVVDERNGGEHISEREQQPERRRAERDADKPAPEHRQPPGTRHRPLVQRALVRAIEDEAAETRHEQRGERSRDGERSDGDGPRHRGILAASAIPIRGRAQPRLPRMRRPPAEDAPDGRIVDLERAA